MYKEDMVAGFFSRLRYALPWLLLAATLIIVPLAAYAQPGVDNPNNGQKQGLDFGVGKQLGLPDDTNPQQRIGKLIVTVINILLGFAAVLALGAMIWGAILIITSAGNEDRVKTGRKAITWAIIGLLIIGLSFLIVRFIGQTLGAVAPAGGGGNGPVPPPGF